MPIYKPRQIINTNTNQWEGWNLIYFTEKNVQEILEAAIEDKFNYIDY